MHHLTSYSLKYFISLHIDKVITLYSSSDKNKFEPSNMQLNMLESNHIEGIASPKYEGKNDLHSYTYHIPMHYKTLSELKITLTPTRVISLLKQIVEVLHICEKHFLLSNRVVLHPDLLFINEKLDHVLAIYIPIKLKFDISERDLIRNITFQLVDLVGYWDSKSFSELFALINHGHFSIQKLKVLLSASIDQLSQRINDQTSNKIVNLQVKEENKKSIINSLKMFLQTMFKIKTKRLTIRESVGKELDNVFPTTILAKQSIENSFAYYLSESKQNNVNEISIQDGFSKLGRDNRACQIHLQLNNVSRRHLEFNLSNKKLQVRDLNSKNGTKLNDISLRPNKWYSVIEGDSLQIADKVYYLRIQSLLLSNHNLRYN